jgi:hypothetical protein
VQEALVVALSLPPKEAQADCNAAANQEARGANHGDYDDGVDGSRVLARLGLSLLSSDAGELAR